jgi:hypothetical protein
MFLKAETEYSLNLPLHFSWKLENHVKLQLAQLHTEDMRTRKTNKETIRNVGNTSSVIKPLKEQILISKPSPQATSIYTTGSIPKVRAVQTPCLLKSSANESCLLNDASIQEL